MTREEFDAKHKATESTTEGYTPQQLAWVNNYVFDAVAHLPMDSEIARDHMQNMMQIAFGKADLYLAMYEKMREMFEDKHG